MTHNKVAIVDPEDFNELNSFTWRAVKSAHCWYALRRKIHNGKIYRIKMHRQIAKTLPGFVCHHKNGRGLDNRRANLENMYPLQHRTHHIVYRHQKKIKLDKKGSMSVTTNTNQPQNLGTDQKKE